MNYDRVSHIVPDLDDDEELQALSVPLPPRTIDCKHKVLYTCLGVVLTTKLFVVGWLIAQGVAADLLWSLFHW
jgi:hypothetical protein